MLFKRALSRRIGELCADRNITINKLAETSTIPPSTLRDIVNCKVENPSSMVIYQICKTLKNNTLQKHIFVKCKDSLQ